MTAWIEITYAKQTALNTVSVAVFMTAWIEIFEISDHLLDTDFVAVFMTAWIEISFRLGTYVVL